MQGFRWHEKARLFGPDGQEQPRLMPFDPLPDPAIGSAALASVLGGPEGAAFRIGGAGAIEAGQGAFETLTGGSLGRPRRVIRTQASWIASFTVNAGLFDIAPGTRVAVLGKLVHSLALYAAIEALHLGAELHVLEDLRPDRQAKALADRGIHVLYATPAQLRPVMAAAARQDRPLSLRQVVIGGARLDAGLRALVATAAPLAVIHEFYGAAETSFITLASNDATGETVGQPYPGVQLRLKENGLIWVQSPYLFQSYAGEDPGSARRDGAWLTVGEIGELGPNGLVLYGREGRMVTVADRNVFPDKIEGFLLGLPGVDRAAILPVADAARGHVLLACLMGDQTAEPTIQAALLAELGPTLAPKSLIWRQDWPTLPSGKTDLARLAQEHPSWR
ncbi:AMP-binding protein [Thioclava sp. FR2]|uniref:AMP-binding protein n=1 Tax=Thioclava sp. FR2 TaxID=3445780 RepID=UPI003EBEEC7E